MNYFYRKKQLKCHQMARFRAVFLPVADCAAAHNRRVTGVTASVVAHFVHWF
jgi:hypothetical protein